MADHSAFDRTRTHLERLHEPVGLLEQFNLPPNVITFIRRNQRAIWVAVIGVVATVVAISIFSSYREWQMTKAAAALENAMAAGEGKAEALASVIDEFGGTPSGTWARVELAHLKAGQEDRAGAIEILKAINLDLREGDTLKPLVQLYLGGLYEQEENFAAAVSTYEALSADPGFSAEAWHALGRVYELQGDKEQAIAMFEKYLGTLGGTEGAAQSDPKRQVVEERIRRLGR